MLEPRAGKLSCTVPRGEWDREAPDLPDPQDTRHLPEGSRPTAGHEKAPPFRDCPPRDGAKGARQM
jgi:hypothetical protein